MIDIFPFPSSFDFSHRLPLLSYLEMVQSVTLSTVATCGKSRLYGSSSSSWMEPFKPFKRSQINSFTSRHCVWNQCVFLTGCPYVLRRSGFKAEAGWMFRGGEKGLDACAEHSESANEDILMFFFQLDLATRVQYALNMEEYDIAQQLRNKLTEVEEEVIKQQQSKRGLSSKSEAQDKGLSIIRLRSDLQKAIENEDYALAAELRDEISKLEAESLAASAKALAHENAQYAFRLGQKVRHKLFGYRAVICGMDPVCGESSSWMENAQIKKLSRGSTQPFYQVLVDVLADPNILVAYVPEENLLTPDQPDMGRLDHPYISFLFYGMDSAGDFIPIKQLREKYNRPRHELPFDEDGSKA